MKSARAAEAGFTLLEMMVTLVVLGLLLSGLTAALHFALAANAREDALLARSGRLEATGMALRRLIEAAEPGSAAGTAHALNLVTRLPLAVGAADPTVDATLLVNRRHQLVLLYRPHPWGLPLPPLPAPTARPLLNQVAGLDVSYWWQKPNTARPAWYPTGPYGTLPRLIRLRLRFRTGPSWPALIAAPALMR